MLQKLFRPAVPSLPSLEAQPGAGEACEQQTRTAPLKWLASAHMCMQSSTCMSGGRLHSHMKLHSSERRTFACKAPLMQAEGTCACVQSSTHTSGRHLHSHTKLHSCKWKALCHCSHKWTFMTWSCPSLLQPSFVQAATQQQTADWGLGSPDLDKVLQILYKHSNSL